MPRPVEMPDDAVVIRFAPTTAEGVLKKAEVASRQAEGHYLSSVWAATARPGETDDELVRRLLTASSLKINPDNNPNYFVCTTAAALKREGFNFVKDDYEGEPPDHFSVDLGTHPTAADSERFLATFERRKRQA